MSPAAKQPDRRPPYQHAADELRREIKAGRYKPGEQLPSYRELQERFGVANMTARSALNVLRDEGLIYTIHGRGSFVTDHDTSAPSGDYTPPAWYLADNRPDSETTEQGVPDDGETAGTTLVELLATLRDEIRTLSAEHQQLRREVEELKAQQRQT
ncbi:GntR family transcriptional regulator [Streptomyces sp. NPDC004609]|uniref:GntR family transcriptional regulator n=1 Tax=Streptomyces sp. NPDC004609 TaxID=3364704 RepID=UPI0036926437